MSRTFFVLFQLFLILALVLSYYAPIFVPLALFCGPGLLFLGFPIDGLRGYRYLGVLLIIVSLVLTIILLR